MCAFHNHLDFVLLRLRHTELVQRLLNVIHENQPFFFGYHEMAVRISHRATRVVLWPTGGLAKQLGDEVFESRSRYSVMGLIYARVRIEPRIGHDPVDQVIDDGSDVVNAAKSIIQRWLGG
jgi:hypothetical protein